MKRGGPIQRKTRLKQKTPIQRKTRIRAKGGRRIKAAVDEDFTAWIWTQPCIVATYSHPGRAGVPPCSGDVIAAHRLNRSVVVFDGGMIFPCCVGHHDWQHQANVGIKEFQRLTGIDLGACCVRYWNTYSEGVEDGRIQRASALPF